MNQTHRKSSLFIFCTLAAFCALACNETKDSGEEYGQHQIALVCLEFSDQEIGKYAKDHWDTNNNDCIEKSEAADVTSIPDNAFANNTKIQSLDDLNQFPNLTSIGVAAFSGCTNLQSANLSNIVSIGESAFANCSNLEYADMPNASNIADNAFEGCPKLNKTATCPNECPNKCDESGKCKTNTIECPKECPNECDDSGKCKTNTIECPDECPYDCDSTGQCLDCPFGYDKDNYCLNLGERTDFTCDIWVDGVKNPSGTCWAPCTARDIGRKIVSCGDTPDSYFNGQAAGQQWGGGLQWYECRKQSDNSYKYEMTNYTSCPQGEAGNSDWGPYLLYFCAHDGSLDENLQMHVYYDGYCDLYPDFIEDGRSCIGDQLYISKYNTTFYKETCHYGCDDGKYPHCKSNPLCPASCPDDCDSSGNCILHSTICPTECQHDCDSKGKCNTHPICPHECPYACDENGVCTRITMKCPSTCPDNCDQNGVCNVQCPASCPDDCDKNGVCKVNGCSVSCVNGCQSNGICKCQDECPYSCNIDTGACWNKCELNDECLFKATNSCIGKYTAYQFKKTTWNITAQNLTLTYPFRSQEHGNFECCGCDATSNYCSARKYCTIHWGDGTSTEVTDRIVEDPGSPYYGQLSGWFTGNVHQYKTPGQYTVQTDCNFILDYYSPCDYFYCTWEDGIFLCEEETCMPLYNLCVELDRLISFEEL